MRVASMVFIWEGDDLHAQKKKARTVRTSRNRSRQANFDTCNTDKNQKNVTKSPIFGSTLAFLRGGSALHNGKKSIPKTMHLFGRSGGDKLKKSSDMPQCSVVQITEPSNHL